VNNLVTCALTNLGVGAANRRSILLTTTVNSGIISGTRIVNSAVVTGSGALATVSSTVTTTVSTVVNLSVNPVLDLSALASKTGSSILPQMYWAGLLPELWPIIIVRPKWR
jgi:hypothetical protein